MSTAERYRLAWMSARQRAEHKENEAVGWAGLWDEVSSVAVQRRERILRLARGAARYRKQLVGAERAAMAWARTICEVELVIDKALGPDPRDGTGEGTAADVALVVEQRDQAHAALARVLEWCDYADGRPEYDSAPFEVRELVAGGAPE